MGLIVDTGLFIRSERAGGLDPLTVVPRGQESAISAITASELLEGVHQADNEARAQQRLERIDIILRNVPVVSFTLEVARVHARLRSDLRRRGLLIGAHDLIIAATGMHMNWGVLTMNSAEFVRIENLRVVEA